MDQQSIAIRSIQIMANGSRADFAELVAPVVFYTEDARVDAVFPPTGKRFAITQSHWFRIEEDKIVEHWANCDDLGMAKQLGWVPPTPAYLFRMARAKRAAERAMR